MNELQLNRLELQNFRCFEHLTIDFHPQMTVLVAENGAGKTAVLEAIVLALVPFVEEFDEGMGFVFQLSDIYRWSPKGPHLGELLYAPEGVTLKAYGHVPGEQIGPDLSSPEVIWERHLAYTRKSRTTTNEANALVGSAKVLKRQVGEGKTVSLPLIAYYGTGRLWRSRKLEGHQLKHTSRLVGYKDSLESAASYKIFYEWFHDWTVKSSNDALLAHIKREPRVRSEFDDYLESVVNAISTCLSPLGWYRIQYDDVTEELMALHLESGPQPVAQLSDGVRNMIGLVADIAFRATKLNPHLGAEAALQTEGIVLIDEVDMHLHPSWQQTVLASLQEAFPKLQFVVSTHSPQVLSTVSREHIRVLEQRDGQYIASMPGFSPLAHESGDALARIMQVHKEPELTIQQDIRAFEQMVRAGQEQSEEAQGLKARIDAQGYQFHDSDLTLWRFLAKQGPGGSRHG